MYVMLSAFRAKNTPTFMALEKKWTYAKQAQCSCKISSSANDEIGLLSRVSRVSVARTCGEVPSMARAEAMAWRCHQKCHKDKTADNITSRL